MMNLIYLKSRAFLSSQQTLRQGHSIKMADYSLENVALFKYIGLPTNQNCVHWEMKSRLNVGLVCYHLVWKLRSSYLLSKNMKVKAYWTILHAVLYGCETWSFTLREEHWLRMWNDRMMVKNVCGCEVADVTGDWKILHYEECPDL